MVSEVQESEVKLETIWQNIRNGEIYQVIGFGKSANEDSVGQKEVYYRNLETGEFYNRKLSEFVEKFKSADLTTRVCKNCLSTKLALFSSMDKKVCVCCGEEIIWRLEDNQQRLFENSKITKHRLFLNLKPS